MKVFPHITLTKNSTYHLIVSGNFAVFFSPYKQFRL